MKTDRRTYWEWYKCVFGVKESVVIFDVHSSLQLLFGNGIGNSSYVEGIKLLNTISNPRTNSEQWRYLNHEENLEKLYSNILLDMRDIIMNNWERILREEANKYKEDIPNQKHFQLYLESHEKFARNAFKTYGVKDQDVLQVFEIVLSQVEILHGKNLEDIENILLELAAMLEKVIWDTYGGERFFNSEVRAIILRKVGSTKRAWDIPRLIFSLWKYPEYLEMYKDDFLGWYNEEEICRKL